MKAKLVPAVGVVVAATMTSLLAGAATTVTLAVATKALAASEAVRFWAPALISVAEKLRVPLVSVESAGSTTPVDVSLLLKCTVPA